MNNCRWARIQNRVAGGMLKAALTAPPPMNEPSMPASWRVWNAR
jgi:hypothetical protein